MSAVLDELNRVVGALPPDLAREVLDFARFLEQRRTQPIVEYGEWTEEEMREASVDSLRRFDAEHANDDWSGLLDDQESGNAPPR